MLTSLIINVLGHIFLERYFTNMIKAKLCKILLSTLSTVEKV